MKPKIVAIFTLTVAMLFGALTSSQANGNRPYAEVTFSNDRPNVGDPIAIYLDLYNCSSLPTSLTVTLYRDFDDLVATLTKSNAGFKVKKVGNSYRAQWLYQGPTSDGVTDDWVFAVPRASGGCVTDPDLFSDESDDKFWYPSPIPYQLGATSFLLRPELNGISLQWEPYFKNAADPSLFYEIQYAIAGSGNWSSSFVTRDWNYKLTGLTKRMVYDIRLRAGNASETSEWYLFDSQGWLASSRTPASYTVTSKKVDGTPTRTFGAGDTVKINMKLDECSIQPNEAGGSLSYGISTADSRAESLIVSGKADSQGFIYDAELETYQGDIEIPNLPNGKYRFDSLLIGNCGWQYSPQAVGSPAGNSFEFTVGPNIVEVPMWGFTSDRWFSSVEVLSQNSSSATLTWAQPLNIEDGLFTYTVEQLTSGGTKVIGTTKNRSYTVSKLSAGTEYEFKVSASNSATTSPSLRPVSYAEIRTGNLTVKRASKLTAVAYAKAIGVTVPTGATLTIARPTGSFLFSDCTFAKNVVTFKNAMGACSVQLTIKPKKVGKTQPKSIISQHDVMIKR